MAFDYNEIIKKIDAIAARKAKIRENQDIIREADIKHALTELEKAMKDFDESDGAKIIETVAAYKYMHMHGLTDDGSLKCKDVNVRYEFGYEGNEPNYLCMAYVEDEYDDGIVKSTDVKLRYNAESEKACHHFEIYLGEHYVSWHNPIQFFKTAKTKGIAGAITLDRIKMVGYLLGAMRCYLTLYRQCLEDYIDGVLQSTTNVLHETAVKVAELTK